MRGGDIAFDMDVARFRAGEGWTYLEIYFSVPRNAVTHIPADSGFLARLETEIRIMRRDSVLMHKQDILVDPVDDLSELDAVSDLYNVFPFYLKPGEYDIRFHVTDVNSGKSGWIERPAAVAGFQDDALRLSDIQLATQIRPDTTRNIYYKNGYAVIPNAGALYGLELPVLYYYAEIYGLSPLVPEGDSTYSVSAFVQDLNGNVVKAEPIRKKNRMGTSLVEVGRIHVAGLTSGAYRLSLNVEDGGASTVVSSDKPFAVYRRADYLSREDAPGPAVTSLASEFDGMAEEDLDAHFAYCDYIATQREKRDYKRLDENGKRDFLKKFWANRDENSMTVENETKLAYFARINQSNQRFGSITREGWKTDPGRIFILHGEPEEIERFSGDMGRRYYEIWHYYRLEGNVIFVFVDIQGYGRLQLVHSTHSRETRDFEWRRWIY